MFDTNITLKRNTVGYIGCLFLAAIYQICALLLIVLMTSWGPESLIILIVGVLIYCMFVFIRLAVSIYKQPVITLTNDKLIIINNELVLDPRDVIINISNNDFSNDNIFIILLMGIIPGLLMFFFQGRNRIVIIYSGERFEIRNISENNINLLCNFLQLPNNTSIGLENELSDNLNDLRERDKVRKKREKNTFVYILSFFPILLFLVLSTNYIYPKIINNKYKINNNYNSGLGTKGLPYIIKTKEQFEYFLCNSNSNNYYSLKSDIDFNGEELMVIGYNSGHFDGNGHKITNFKMTEQNYYIGLFRYNSGTIKNVGIENFVIDIKEEDGYDKEGFIIGPLVAYNKGLIINCYAFNGNIVINSTDGYIIAGGLVGANYEEISNSYSTCNITANSEHNYVLIGGFVGKHSSDIKIYNCFATGNIDSTVTLEIENCQAGGFSPVIFYETNYRYQDQIIKRTFHTPPVTTYSPGFNFDHYCSLDELNSKSFYVDKLKWDENIWDFSNLDFINGKLPRLK